MPTRDQAPQLQTLDDGLHVVGNVSYNDAVEQSLYHVALVLNCSFKLQRSKGGKCPTTLITGYKMSDSARPLTMYYCNSSSAWTSARSVFDSAAFLPNTCATIQNRTWLTNLQTQADQPDACCIEAFPHLLQSLRVGHDLTYKFEETL